MLNERLKKVIAQAGVTQGVFADATGIGLERTRNLVAGRVQKMHPHELKAVRDAYGIREIWLSDGKGPMRLTQEEIAMLPGMAAIEKGVKTALELQLSKGESEFVSSFLGLIEMRDSAGIQAMLEHLRRAGAPSTLDEDFVMVPRYDVAASAGGGQVVHDEAVVDHLAFRRDWVTRSLGLDPKHLALIDINGDSMQGTIDDGDLVLLDTRAGRLYGDGIYVIQLHGMLLCKRLHYKISGVVEVISDNPAYATEVVSAQEVERLTIVGRVVWQGKKV